MERGFSAGVVTCLPGIGAPSPAQTPWGRAHRAIEAGYLRLFAAAAAADSDGFLAQLAPGFFLELPDGHQLDAAATGALLRQQWRTVERSEIDGRITRLSVRGTEAETLIQEETRTLAADDGGRALAMLVSEQYADTWALFADGAWRLRGRRLLVTRTVLPDGGSA